MFKNNAKNFNKRVMQNICNKSTLALNVYLGNVSM